MIFPTWRAVNGRGVNIFFVCAILVGGPFLIIDIVSFYLGFEGPSTKLRHGCIFGPKQGLSLWSLFVFTMMGLEQRERIRFLLCALGIELLFFFVGHSSVTFGVGALLTLFGIAIWANVYLSELKRLNILKSVGISLLLIIISKMNDAWLRITAITQPQIFDAYVANADWALGNPAWMMGRLIKEGGFFSGIILETVYSQLQLAAMIVAAYQLRKGWPSHHIIRTFTAIGLIGPLIYLLFPVVGPVYVFSNLGKEWAFADAWPTTPLFWNTPRAIPFDNFTPRNCMPSLHTAWAVAIFLHTRVVSRWMRLFGTFWLITTLIAALGFGYHYGVDLVAGVVFSLTVESGLRDPERGWGCFRWLLIVGGIMTLVGLLLSYRYLSSFLAAVPLFSGPLIFGAMILVIIFFYITFFVPSPFQLSQEDYHGQCNHQNYPAGKDESLRVE